MRFAILSSTNGSIVKAIIQKSSHLGLRIFITNKECPALQIAREAELPTRMINSEKELSEVLDYEGIDYIILAGYMKILSPEFVNKYKNRIINTHPSLLPSFPGGSGIHEKVLARGCKVSGCTIHFVDEGVDTGPIIAQGPVMIQEGETPESLKEKVQQVERELYPKVLDMLHDGKIDIIDNIVKIKL